MTILRTGDTVVFSIAIVMIRDGYGPQRPVVAVPIDADVETPDLGLDGSVAHLSSCLTAHPVRTAMIPRDPCP
ncbi:hypothetical protein ABMA10_21045 [Plantibacter sp. RU18]